MPFSIGGALRGAIGGFLAGGPAGAVLGGLGGGFAPKPASFPSAAPMIGSSFFPGGIFPGVPSPQLPPPGQMITGPGMVASPGGMMVITAAERVKAIAAKIFVFIGRRISPRVAWVLVRRIGPAAAAVALGILVSELFEYIISGRGGAATVRRGRGISARDFRRTRSTLRKIETLACALGTTQAAAGVFRRRAHRAGCPCPRCK